MEERERESESERERMLFKAVQKYHDWRQCFFTFVGIFTKGVYSLELFEVNTNEVTLENTAHR